jgi:FPC/CPF motif-containing protein YcgG
MEFKRRLEDVSRSARGCFDPDPFTRIEFLAPFLKKQRFVVEQIHLTGAPVHEELDDSSNFGSMVQSAIQFRNRSVGEQPIPSEQIGESE